MERLLLPKYANDHAFAMQSWKRAYPNFLTERQIAHASFLRDVSSIGEQACQDLQPCGGVRFIAARDFTDRLKHTVDANLHMGTAGSWLQMHITGMQCDRPFQKRRYDILGDRAIGVQWSLGDGSILKLLANLGAEPVDGIAIEDDHRLWLEGSVEGDRLGGWTALVSLIPAD